MARRITRRDAVNFIVQNLQQQGINVAKEIRIGDTPDSLRHSCVQTRICFLQRNLLPVSDENMGTVELPYYYCQYCGNLYVYERLWD